MDETTDLFVGGSSGAPLQRTTGTRLQVAAGAEGVEQERSETLKIGGGSSGVLLRFHGGLRNAGKFVETHGNGLAEVHGTMLFARGDPEEPMAVAKVFVRKAAFLRTKKKGDAAGCEMFVEETRSLIEAPKRVLQLASAYGGGSHNE
jgi:hypothetical protein